MNEYMAVDDRPAGTRLATFPDVITTLDAPEGDAAQSAGQLRSGDESCSSCTCSKTIIPLSSSRA
jgi:DUF917 family protein